ncbi:hypothetical protein [Mesorhizobium sp.]|uniref:hypothetical protein n=1 Tax=Mesorhizobium sp. TaxID=1871066 RepID=UPI000FE992D9|nr:hypothetical protein [Mesorhizobium sp.]RWJ01278.1 MAG: hypothetical protein EOR23_25590 [Mesorhizobium sp.]TIP95613.1 MAG: hypothetical protein E5X58_02190 [Mesorhizobium sp.]
MSRYTITVTGTVTGQSRSDPEAIIGYDPPLRTFFLQAFPHDVTDDPALWLGTHDHAFERLEDLHRAALARGFDFMPLSAEMSSKLIEDKVAAGAAARVGLAEFLK